MEARLVVFILFLISLASIMTLNGFKKYHDPSKKIVIDLNAKPEGHGEKVEVATGPSPIELGKAIYTEKGQCMKCHGVNGEGNLSERAPILKGQHDWYIVSTLKKFKSGDRVNKKMDEYIKDLSPDDFKNVAKYITTLK